MVGLALQVQVDFQGHLDPREQEVFQEDLDHKEHPVVLVRKVLLGQLADKVALEDWVLQVPAVNKVTRVQEDNQVSQELLAFQDSLAHRVDQVLQAFLAAQDEPEPADFQVSHNIIEDTSNV